MVVVLYGSDRKITDSQGSRNVTPAQGETVLCSRLQKGPGLNMPKGVHMGHQRGWVRIRLQVDELSLFPLGVPLSHAAKALCRLHGVRSRAQSVVVTTDVKLQWDILPALVGT